MAITERLTYAELDYLLDRHPQWRARRRELGFPEPTGSETTAAGLASLLARRLADLADEGVRVDNRVLGLSRVLAEANTFVYLSRADEQALSTGMITVDAAPMLISLIAPGCVELLALDVNRPREDLVMALVVAAAGDGDGDVLGLAAPGETAILIGRMDDQWLLGGDPEKGDPAVVDEATVRAAVARVVERAQAAGSA